MIMLTAWGHRVKAGDQRFITGLSPGGPLGPPLRARAVQSDAAPPHPCSLAAGQHLRLSGRRSCKAVAAGPPTPWPAPARARAAALAAAARGSTRPGPRQQAPAGAAAPATVDASHQARPRALGSMPGHRPPSLCHRPPPPLRTRRRLERIVISPSLAVHGIFAKHNFPLAHLPYISNSMDPSRPRTWMGPRASACAPTSAHIARGAGAPFCAPPAARLQQPITHGGGRPGKSARWGWPRPVSGREDRRGANHPPLSHPDSSVMQRVGRGLAPASVASRAASELFLWCLTLSEVRTKDIGWRFGPQSQRSHGPHIQPPSHYPPAGPCGTPPRTHRSGRWPIRC